jgi:hypothetical protein
MTNRDGPGNEDSTAAAFQPIHDGKREAKQQRATLVTVASRAAKKGFRGKDQQKGKVAA